MSDLVINCQQLSKVYQDGDNEVAVLKGVDFCHRIYVLQH